MINIKRLNPKYILPNGRYWDYVKGEMYLLYDDEILAIRKYYNNPNIAANRIIEEYKEPIVSRGYSSISKEVSNLRTKSDVVSSTTGKRFKVSRSQKFNNGKHKMGSTKDVIKFKNMVALGMTVFFVASSFMVFNHKVIGETVDKVEEETDYEYITDIYADIDKSRAEVNVTREYIDKYAQIFHLNGEVAYNKLSEITNNFTSEDYTMEMTCKDLTCKGMPIYADSYEELIIYFMRVLKQEPERYGLTKEEVTGNVDFQSNDYIDDHGFAFVIADYCSILREDPCLIYSIIQAETGWDSDALNNEHNPFGLMLNGELWKFDTFEEGLIETIAQIKHYRIKGANTIEEIGAMHCPVDNDSTGMNSNWVENVSSIYDDVMERQEELFGEVYVENVLTR